MPPCSNGLIDSLQGAAACHSTTRLPRVHGPGHSSCTVSTCAHRDRINRGDRARSTDPVCLWFHLLLGQEFQCWNPIFIIKKSSVSSIGDKNEQFLAAVFWRYQRQPTEIQTAAVQKGILEAWQIWAWMSPALVPALAVLMTRPVSCRVSSKFVFLV